jgi:hypothetical protein
MGQSINSLQCNLHKSSAIQSISKLSEIKKKTNEVVYISTAARDLFRLKVF